MKKLLFILLAVASLSACHKTGNTPQISFDIPYTQTAQIPGVTGYSEGNTIPPGGAQMSFAPVNVFTNAQQFFIQNGIGAKNVAGTYIGSMSVQITTPGFHYFDFLDKFEMYISTPGQPEVMVAYDYNVPYGLKFINLTVVPGLNLKNYIVGDSVTVRLNAYVNYVPTPAQLLLNGDFQVTANPL